MLNIHLNGDIVRCPDMEQIQSDVKRRREKMNKCCYGIIQHECEQWREFNRRNVMKDLRKWDNSEFTKRICQPCTLKGTKQCPKHLDRVEKGKQQKVFKIDSKTYRKLSSGASYMVKNSPHKTIFFTLTFPQFKRETNESEINQCFSKFMENLHNNYNVKYYIAVREYGEVNFRPHFHVLCSFKYINFSILNNAWNAAISDICEYSKSAFRTTRKTVILFDPGKALRYCCKYFSKAKHTRSNTRIVFMSMPLIIKAVKQRGLSGLAIVHDLFNNYKSIYVNQMQYVTIMRIVDQAEFDDFCSRFIYPLFEIDQGKTDFSGIPNVEGVIKN